MSFYFSIFVFFILSVTFRFDINFKSYLRSLDQFYQLQSYKFHKQQQSEQQIFQMNRKQSHQPIGSQQNQHQKNHYQPSSPYIDLLDSKKGVYGHRYDTKNVRSFTNYVKPSPASITSIFYQKAKPFKSTSTQKVKIGSYTNQKKKRSRTQQAEQKMHESLFIYPTMPQKPQQQPSSKSLFYPQQKPPHQYKFEPNKYFQQLTGQKNKRKRHLSQNKHNHVQSQNTINNTSLPINLLENLHIHDIDALIHLIDNCVTQANQYITYLSDQMSTLKDQLYSVKARVRELEDVVQRKNGELGRKEDVIRQLEKKIGEVKDNRKDNGFQVKNLLQIIEKLSQQNERLRSQIEQAKPQRQKRFHTEQDRPSQKQKQRQKQKQKDPRCDYYNQIHSKIDILNISIDNNHNFHPGKTQPQGKDRSMKDAVKQFKFIKPKGR